MKQIDYIVQVLRNLGGKAEPIKKSLKQIKPNISTDKKSEGQVDRMKTDRLWR